MGTDRSIRIITLLLMCISASTVFARGHAEGTEHGDAHAYEIELPGIGRLTGDAERLRIVATTSIVGDVVEQVAGEAADVTVLMQVGQNPHSYEATPSALRALEKAHIIFLSGLGLEEGLFEDIERLTKGVVVSLSVGIDPLEGRDHEEDGEHDHEGVDPHVWTDPSNVMIWVSNLVEILTNADPDNARTYTVSGARYREELEKLDSELRTTFESVSPDRKKLVTDHSAFTYFANAYGFDVIGVIVPGVSDQGQPSTQAVGELVELIRKERVNAIYVGATASRGITNLAETIAKEAQRPIRILPTLTGSLTKKGEPGDTYIGYMRYNAAQILAGLEIQ